MSVFTKLAAGGELVYCNMLKPKEFGPGTKKYTDSGMNSMKFTLPNPVIERLWKVWVLGRYTDILGATLEKVPKKAVLRVGW